MVLLKYFESTEIESRVEKIERELLVIKLVLRRGRKKKIRLNDLISKISSSLVEDVDTTQLIREMRDRTYV